MGDGNPKSKRRLRAGGVKRFKTDAQGRRTGETERSKRAGLQGPRQTDSNRATVGRKAKPDDFSVRNRRRRVVSARTKRQNKLAQRRRRAKPSVRR